METNFVTTSYPVMVGTFYRYKVLPVAIVSIFCVRLFAQFKEMFLRAILGNSHAHNSCVEKQEKLSGTRLSDHLRFWINTVFR